MIIDNAGVIEFRCGWTFVSFPSSSSLENAQGSLSHCICEYAAGELPWCALLSWLEVQHTHNTGSETPLTVIELVWPLGVYRC